MISSLYARRLKATREVMTNNLLKRRQILVRSQNNKLVIECQCNKKFELPENGGGASMDIPVESMWTAELKYNSTKSFAPILLVQYVYPIYYIENK